MVTPKTVRITSCIGGACRPRPATAIAAGCQRGALPRLVGRVIDRGAARLYLIGAMTAPQRQSPPISRRQCLLPIAAGLLLLGFGPAAAQLARFPTAELTIVTGGGPHKFKVEVATTPEQLEQGLMFRQNLAADG